MIYITGDTHADLDEMVSRKFPDPSEMSSDDYIIVTGDFGFVGENFEKRKKLKDLSAYFSNCKILFVCGNHEDFPYLNSFGVSEWNGGKVRIINDNVIYLMRGQIFTINGKKIFTMGGAYSHDGPFRLEWYPKEEQPSLKEYDDAHINLIANDNKVDYIITHTIPKSFLGYIGKTSYPEENHFLGFLDNVYRNVSFDRWFAGHYHIDKELLGGKITIVSEKVIVI